MLTVRTFLASKLGEESDDCQDSIHPFPTPADDADKRFFAVSDGTTTSFFSRAWSATLTRHFAENPDQTFSDWEGWLRDAQKKWEAEVGERARASDASFFTRNGFHAHKPGAATFAALALGEPSENGRPWRALVLGDSCLFFLRETGQPRVMNLQASAEFSSVVKTVESWPKDAPHKPTPHESAPAGSEPPIMEHDTVLLASDALSKWMLLRHERGCPVWKSIFDLHDESAFADLVAKARSEAEDPLENDDVALAILKFGEPHLAYQDHHFKPNPAPVPVLHLPIAPVGNEPGLLAQKSSQVTEFGHLTLPFFPALKFALPKSLLHFSHFAALFTLGTFLLAVVVLSLGASCKHALNQVRAYELKQRQLSGELENLREENEKLNTRANRSESERQDALRERDATARSVREAGKLRDQVRMLESAQKADARKIEELKVQIANLNEQLVKQPSATSDAAPPAPK